MASLRLQQNWLPVITFLCVMSIYFSHAFQSASRDCFRVLFGSRIGRGHGLGARNRHRNSFRTAHGQKFTMLENTALPLREWFTRQGLEIYTFENLGSSDWAQQLRYETKDGQQLFVKTSRKPAAKVTTEEKVDILGRLNEPGKLRMFAGEAAGLKALGAARALAVPEVLHCSDDGLGGSYIVMEYLSLSGKPDPFEFGQAMGRLHNAPPLSELAQKGQFGFDLDNTIGGTPQPNPWSDSWVDFFREHRIKHQLNLAGKSELSSLFSKLCDKTNGLELLFEGTTVKPSVLHGDLWSGNIAAVADGEKASIFDPATYYGHHEAEWGMSWCASLGTEFWKGYRTEVLREEGFEVRRDLYTLYHYLNHYSLFGGGYYGDCIEALDDLIAAT